MLKSPIFYLIRLINHLLHKYYKLIFVYLKNLTVRLWVLALISQNQLVELGILYGYQKFRFDGSEFLFIEYLIKYTLVKNSAFCDKIIIAIG